MERFTVEKNHMGFQWLRDDWLEPGHQRIATLHKVGDQWECKALPSLQEKYAESLVVVRDSLREACLAFIEKL